MIPETLLSPEGVMRSDGPVTVTNDEVVALAFQLSTRLSQNSTRNLVVFAARFLSAGARYRRARQALRNTAQGVRKARANGAWNESLAGALRGRYRREREAFTTAFTRFKAAHGPVLRILECPRHPFGSGASRDELKLILNLLLRKATAGERPVAPRPVAIVGPTPSATEMDRQIRRLAERKRQLEAEINGARERLDAVSSRVVQLETQLDLLVVATDQPRV